MSLAPLLERDGQDVIADRLRPFREQGVLSSVDVHVVDHLGALAGESDPEVLLALALAVRAPSRGHICIDLKELELFAAQENVDVAADAEALPWPTDRDEWLAKISASPLVRATSDEVATDSVAPFVIDGSVLYTDRYYTYQARLAAALRVRTQSQLKVRDADLLQRGLDSLFDDVDGDRLDRQKLGAAMAMLRGFTVIGGGPGTGKTYTVRTVLTLLWAQWALDNGPTSDLPGPRVALAAPTGKAAARMAAALVFKLDEFLCKAESVLPEGRTVEELRAFLTALVPSTIHRLLRYNPKAPSRFIHGVDNPVPHDVVVVDEASMIPFALMAKLVDAAAPDARLILLGDKHQLASVEAGTVLADLCGPTRVSHLTLSDAFASELRSVTKVDVRGKSGLVVSETPGPHDAIVQLDKSRRFREESGIGQFAKACLADDFDASAAVDLLTKKSGFADVALLSPGKSGELNEEVKTAIVKGYRKMLERLLAGPAQGESLEEFHLAVLDRFGEFRLLCAHRRGRGGVEGMNRTVVAILERESRRLAAASSEQGTPNPLAGFAPEGEFWLGRPILVRRNDYVVELFNGDIGIVVRDAGGKLKVAFPKAGGLMYLAPSRLPEHQTVFAMTIHKSQGSEFDHVMVMLPTKDSPLLTRELIYTAVTRGKDKMTLVGKPELLVLALGRSVRRASGLEAALWGETSP